MPTTLSTAGATLALVARGFYRRQLVAAVTLATLAAACGQVDPRAVADRSQSSAGSIRPAAAARTPDTPATAALVSPSGVVVPVLGPAPGGGWAIRTPCNRTATLTGGKSAGSPTIVLDPGHGGSEPGAVSPGGLAEAGVNLAVARIAQGVLEAQGIPTILTRTADYTMELPTRAELARNVAPRAFVSVHHNAEPDEASPRPGSETYYQIGSSDSKRLAGLIYEEITRALSQYRIAWVADRDAGAKYRPGRQGDYYAMLRLPGKVVSVLAELAFISDPPEAALLGRSDVQRVEGEALARGIVRWLRTSDPGSGFTEPYPRTDPAPGPGGPGPICRDPQL